VTNEDILKTEFSPKFMELMKNRMIMSFYKYGPVRQNAGDKLVNEVESLKLRLKKYEQTGNTEYLVDVANFAMIEFMFPSHPKAFFKATDANGSPGLVGMSINEIKAFKEASV
jgi:hypothetical protein